MVMAQVYMKLKEFENAVNVLSSVWEVREAKFGRQSIEVAEVYGELAKIYLKKKEFEEAINY